MAQRGTGFARKPPAVEAPRVEAPPRPLPEEPIPPDPIALDFAPLIAPYRRHGRLTVRVERMPPRARLSRGHINGDRSWSLALDEIEGLAYMPASPADASPTLALRLIRSDGGDGGTLALLDYAVPAPDDSAAPAVPAPDGKELRRLRDELAKLKTSLAIRDAELARMKEEAAPADVELPRETIDAELAALRETWEAEAEARIAAAVKEATATMSKLRGAAKISEDVRIAKLEKSADDRLVQERERLQKEADDALKSAEKEWKAAEAARIAEAEAGWKRRSEKAFAEAAAQLERARIAPQAETARARADDAEKRKLRDDLTRASAALAERETELERERANLKRTRAEAGKLRDAESERLRLQDELAKARSALAESDAELDRERSNVRQTKDEAGKLRNADSERQRLKEELTKARAALAEREAELEHERSNVRQTRDEAGKLRDADGERRRLQGELAKARAALAEQEAELDRERSDAQQTREEAGKLRDADSERQRLQDELAKARVLLAESEAALVRERSNVKQTRDEAGKLRDADSERRRLQDELAKAKALLAERDMELDRERANVKQTRDEAGKLRNADSERQRLKDELTKAKSVLAERELELARVKSVLTERDQELKQAADDAKVERKAADKAAARAELDLDKAKATLAARDEELKQLRSGAENARSEAENLRGDSVELKRVRGELVVAKESLAARTAELARVQKAGEDALRRAEKDSDKTLRDAEKRWKETAAEELAEAKAKWREQSEEAIARLSGQIDQTESRVREEAARYQGKDAELSQMREVQSALKTLLNARDEELAQLKIAHEQARERWVQEAEATLSKAQQAWKIAEASRAAALEGQMQQQAARALNEMTVRAKKAESVVAETRAQNEALRHRGDTADFLRLRKDLSSVQGALARRENELMQLRADHELERERLAVQARAAVQKADEQWRAQDSEPDEGQERTQQVFRLARNLALAAVFGGLAMVGYYKVAPMVTSTGVLDPILPEANTRSVTVPVPPAPAVQRPVLTVLHAAKLRADPSTTASVVGSLPVNTQVFVLEKQDKWVKVEISGAKANDKPQQGWVHGTVLSAPPADVNTTSSTAKK